MKLTVLTFVCFLFSLFSVNSKSEALREERDSVHSMYVDSEEVYSVGKIYADIGLNPDNPYKGSGIKIGIIESALPYYFPDGMNPTLIYDSNDQQNWSPAQEQEGKQHAYDICSILGGPRGIAKEATFFFAASSPNKPKNQCIKELVEDYNVDIITSSTGAAGQAMVDDTFGYYTKKYSLAMDKYSDNSNVLFVNAIGNQSQTEYEYTTTESLGLNVIGVGSCKKDLSPDTSLNLVSVHDNYDDDFFASPTVLAPGTKVFGFRETDRTYYDSTFGSGNIPYNYKTITGTSTSTPMVAGIAALLLEEFPALKSNTRQLVSLICNTCAKATGQTSSFDSDNGFGIVNYQNARKAVANFLNLNILPSYVDDAVLYSSQVSIPIGSKISATSINFLRDIANQPSDEIVPQSSIMVSKCNIILKTTNNVLVASSQNVSNFAKLEFVNNTYDTNFVLAIVMDGDSVCNYIEPVSLNYWVDNEAPEYFSPSSTYYLDVAPTLNYSFNGSNDSQYFQLVYYNMFNETILTKTLNGLTGNITLTSSEWNSVVSVRGKEYYAYLKSWSNNSLVNNGPFFSKTFCIMEPEIFRDSIQILPSDWGFSEQYNNSEITSTSITRGNLVITPKRLRCGYIEGIYVNLSSRKINAGHAYLQLLFNIPVYHFMIGVTQWRSGELTSARENDSVKIKTMDYNGNWVETFDLLNDVPSLPSYRKQVDRYSFNGTFYGIMIDVTTDAFGNFNRGRLCLDDLVLNCSQNNFNGFGSSFYEPIVENYTYIVQ